MSAYIDTLKITDENGNKSILYPRTKQEAVDGLNERLSKLEVADITETEDTTLENSHAGRLLIEEIGGNSIVNEIVTYGKNVIDCSKYTEGTVDGVTLTKNTDYSLRLVGTSTSAQGSLFYLANLPLKAGRYKITKGNENTNIDVWLYADGANNFADSEFTVSNDVVDATLVVMVKPSATVNDNVYIMVRDASIIDDAYEPYVYSKIALSTPIELSAFDKITNTRNGFVLNTNESTEILPFADQIALNSLQTYDGITYVEFISDVQPTFYKFKYGTTEMGGMTLESLLTARSNDLRLSALETSVVNNI